MSLAEKKLHLLQLVMNADEETTGKLIELANRLQDTGEKYTKEELEKFHASRQQYHANPEAGMSVKEAHDHIRALKKP
jgi:hypothetical protein